MPEFPGQRIVFGIAIAYYLAAALSAIGAVILITRRVDDLAGPSLFATALFLASCGVVLQVIAGTRLRGVLSGSGDLPPEPRRPSDST